LRGDLVRLTHGLSLADLVEHSTLEHAPNPLLYDLLTAGLYLTEKLPDPAIAARWFEMQVVGDLGYSPDLAECGVCHRLLDDPDCVRAGEEAGYALSAAAGTALCPWHARPLTNPDHSALSREALVYLRALADLDVEEGDRLATLPVPSKAALEQTRIALRRYLRYRLERDLKTWQFLDSLGPAV
jgi:DNA repair protein RecO (recombination protein O)